MPTTPTFGWPYPAGTDADDVPYWLQQGLVAIENTVKNPPRVGVQCTTNQSIPDNTLTPVNFDTEIHDTHAMHSTVTNTSRLTCVVAGLYAVSMGLTFTSGGSLDRRLQPMRNGVNPTGVGPVTIAGSSRPTSLSIAFEVFLAVGDYVQMGAYQNSGAAVTLAGTSWANFAFARWVASS